MKKLLSVFFVIISFALLYFSGCVPSKPREEVEILSPERLISRLEINRRRINNFEGSGTIQVKTNSMNNSAEFKVIIQKPDSIYFTIMGPFGINLAEALVTKNNFVFYDALHNTAYTGGLSDNVLQNIFRINLPFDQLLNAFAGAVNLTKHLYKQPTKFLVDYDKYVLTYVDSLTNVTTKYYVDIRTLGITNYQYINNKGKVELEGKYSDFNSLDNVAIPYKISVENKQENQQVSISYKKMAANRKAININFKLPEDATVIKW